MTTPEHHDDHAPRTISLVPSTLAFALSAVVGLVGMVLIILFNYHGGF